MVHPVVDSSGSPQSLCRKKNIIEFKFKYKTNKLTSISCVCPLFTDKLLHNIVNVYCATISLQLVVPQTR